MTKPGWYADPNDVTVERYWTGAEWGSNTRPTSAKTKTFVPAESRATTATTERPISNLGPIGAALYFLAAVEAIGAIVGGAILLTTKTCTDTYLGSCFSDRHPFVGVGIAVLIGGLVNAAVIGVVGRLCVIVDGLREYRDADARLVLEEMADASGEEPEFPSHAPPPPGPFS